jgi:hypothetical protein
MANPTVRLPIGRMVETRPRIDAWRFRKSPPEGCRPGPDKVDLELGGRRLGMVWDLSLPWISIPWFVCPSCQHRVRYLYELPCAPQGVEPELRCRRCARLDWASRHGSARAQPLAWKVRSLRRKLGVDEHPFGILPAIPTRHMRRRRIAEAIIDVETELLKQGHVRVQSLMRTAIGQGWRPKKRGGKTT